MANQLRSRQRRRRLRPEQVQELEERGYTIVPGMFSCQLCSELRQLCDRLIGSTQGETVPTQWMPSTLGIFGKRQANNAGRATSCPPSRPEKPGKATPSD